MTDKSIVRVKYGVIAKGVLKLPDRIACLYETDTDVSNKTVIT